MTNPTTTEQLIAAHQSQAATFRDRRADAERRGQQLREEECQHLNGARAASALVDALRAHDAGDTEGVREELRAFYRAYDDGELDALIPEADKVALEATYHALAARYDAETLATGWLRLAPAAQVAGLNA